jgi:colicin import membrane protein
MEAVKKADKRALTARKATEVAVKRAEAMAMQKAVALAAKEAARQAAKEIAREAAKEAAQAAKAAKAAQKAGKGREESTSLTTAEREELSATRESLAMVLKSLEALTSQNASRDLPQVALVNSPVVSQKRQGRNTKNSQKVQSSSQLQRLASIVVKAYILAISSTEMPSRRKQTLL